MRGAPLKRLMDVIVSASALLILFPVLLVVAALVRARMGAPVLFRQTRPGLNGAPFEMIKFRTMRVAGPGEDAPGTGAARITPLGHWLRSTSLDELPELWNVLKGEMSLVGPRPLLMEYLPLYSPEQMRRHAVRPGVTGWAQINGRNAIGWEEKFALDVWYIDNRSFWLDVRILVLTVKKVFRRSDINLDATTTATPFRGSIGGVGDGA